MNFLILPNGLVQGGSASYSIDRFGTITYAISVKVGKWFLSKTYSSQGTYKIDPAMLSPENLAPWRNITIGSLAMTVVRVTGNQALVSVIVSGQDATGRAILLTDGPILTLSSLDATVGVFGMNLALMFRPV